VTVTGVPSLPATLETMVPWLDEVLLTETTPDYDGARNGLQVEHTGPVRRIAAAVDASLRSVELAVAAGANLLIVHHGLFWAGAQPIRGALHRKLSLLLAHDIAVYSAHLPLDRHPTLGNNVLLAQTLGLVPSATWLAYKGLDVGVMAETELPTRELAERAVAFGRLHAHHTVVTPHATERMTRRVAVCSGAGASSESMREARARGADTLIVGEGPHHTAVDAEESGLVVMYAGHYATETLGVQALARHTGERWQLPWSFLSAPTGL
jgi:dinuclear metal center YbgI/SA1388 family protein